MEEGRDEAPIMRYRLKNFTIAVSEEHIIDNDRNNSSADGHHNSMGLIGANKAD